MNLLSVEGLSKSYKTFQLRDISFSLPAGYIMGFIGRNGAGKTTTIKAMLNLVHPDAGRVSVLGQDYYSHEEELKKLIGLALGSVSYYPGASLARITDVFKRFYDTWEEATYRTYLDRFELDETKKVQQLSAGMRVKYTLALALSHQASLLILDEPTSGLDPVSRDDLLDIFRELIEEGERSILFSTQITSDLDKCADYITYIRKGRIQLSCDRDEFLGGHRLVKGTKAQLTTDLTQALIGFKATDLGFTGLIRSSDQALADGCVISAASIEDIMIYYERPNPAKIASRKEN